MMPNPKPSIIDRVIGAISPKTQYNRTRFRTATNILNDYSRKYDGATKGRRGDGWTTVGGTSPNSETQMQLGTLRERSREQVRNNAYGHRLVQAIRNNTVGTGIIPSPNFLGKEKKPEFKNIIDKVKDTWWRWAETTACDYDGRETFVGLQTLVMSTVVESGECLIRRRRVTGKNYVLPIQLQVVEPDLIDNSKESTMTEGGGWIIQGVEFDKNGKRKCVWMYDRHPSDPGVNMSSKPVSFTDVLHVYLAERAGQVRGVPWSASVMLRMKDYDDYEDAQLIRQKIAACFSVFISDTSENITPGMSGVKATEEKDRLSRVEPGIIEYLEPGKEVKFATPPPMEGFETYSRKVLQGVAAGLGVSYEALTGDLSNVNFSSGRMGWLEFHRNIQEWQKRMLIPGFCDPVWAWFLDAMKIKGILTKDIEVVADWTPGKREMIDPVREIKGLSDEVRNGFRSWQDAVRQRGFDPDELLRQIAEDNEKFDEFKLKLVSDARNDFIPKVKTDTTQQKQ